MIKALIFDLDGTLLDTLQDLADSVNRTLEARGLPTHPIDSYRTFVGSGARKLVERALPENMRDEQTVDAIHEEYRTDYADTWADNTKPYPGIEAMLKELLTTKMPICILSNKPHEFTKLCVERFFPNVPFTCVHGAREGIPLKPDPKSAISICDELGIPAADTAYIGDSDVDMKTGNGAGMHTIGVTWGFRPAELKDAGADHTVDSPARLVDLIIN